MKLRLNGEPYETRPGITLDELLAELELGGAKVAVAINGSVAPRGSHSAMRLTEGDEVEVIQAVAGG